MQVRMIYKVVFSPEAEDQLISLYYYIAEIASPEIAAKYTEGIVDYCNSLQVLTNQGTMRDDIRTGLRVTNYKKRTVIAYCDNSDFVSILKYTGYPIFLIIVDPYTIKEEKNYVK